MNRRFRLFNLGRRASAVLNPSKTYYVRPSGTTYGDGSGTSYANAWSGEANIDWGLMVDNTLIAVNFAPDSITSLEPTATILYTSGIGTMEISQTFFTT